MTICDLYRSKTRSFSWFKKIPKHNCTIVRFSIFYSKLMSKIWRFLPIVGPRITLRLNARNPRAHAKPIQIWTLTPIASAYCPFFIDLLSITKSQLECHNDPLLVFQKFSTKPPDHDTYCDSDCFYILSIAGHLHHIYISTWIVCIGYYSHVHYSLPQGRQIAICTSTQIASTYCPWSNITSRSQCEQCTLILIRGQRRTCDWKAEILEWFFIEWS